MMASLAQPLHTFSQGWDLDPSLQLTRKALPPVQRYADFTRRKTQNDYRIHGVPSNLHTNNIIQTPNLNSLKSKKNILHLPSSEHLLRRKTPIGTLTAAYDATPVDPGSRAHVSKHILVSSAASIYNSSQQSSSYSKSMPAGKSFAVRERERLLSRELQQANNGLQNFVFSPTLDKTWDPPASSFQSFGNSPQVDSLLHGPSIYYDAYGHPNTFFGAPNGFSPPVQAPLGPTASNCQTPYGPYWPNGAFVPYRPAALEDHRYSSQVIKGSSECTAHLKTENFADTSLLFPYDNINSPMRSQNQATNQFFDPQHQNAFGSGTFTSVQERSSDISPPMGLYDSFHSRKPLAACRNCLNGVQCNSERDTKCSLDALRKFPTQNQIAPYTNPVPSPSLLSTPDQILSWAHSVYSQYVTVLQRQAQTPMQDNSRYAHTDQNATIRATIFPEPVQQISQDLYGMHNRTAFRGSSFHLGKDQRQYPSVIAESRLGLSRPSSEIPDVWSEASVLKEIAIKALDRLGDLCNDSPTCIEALLLGGCLAYILGKFQKALQWYSKILDMDVNHVEAISNLAATFLALNRRQEAEAHWRLAVNLRPMYFEAAEHLVGLLCFDRRHQEAVRIIDYIQDSLRYHPATMSSTQIPSKCSRRYLNAVPDNGRIMALIHAKGNILYNLHDHAGAARAFEEVVLIAANQHDGGIDLLINKIIESLTRSPHRPDQSKKVKPERMLLPPSKALQTAKRAFPHQGVMLGLSFLSTFRSKEAAISITSNSLLSLAKIFQDGISSSGIQTDEFQPSHSVTDILALYYLSLSLQPSPSTANNVGILLASIQPSRVQAPLEAEQTMESPPFPGVVPGSGVHLALLYYQYGLSLDSKHAHLYTNLGSLLKDIGQLNVAIPMYQKAVDCDPNFDIALANLANAVKDQGKISDAIRHYQRAVQVNPGFAEAVCGLANALNSVCDWAGRGGIKFQGGLFDRYHVDAEGGLLDSLTLLKTTTSGWIPRVVEIVDSQLVEGETWGIGTAQDHYINGLVTQLQAVLDVMAVGENAASVYKFLKNCANQKLEGYKITRFVERAIRLINRQWYLDKNVKKSERSLHHYRRLQLPTNLTTPKAPTVLPFHTFTFPLTAKQIRLISQRNGLRVSVSTFRSPWLPSTVFPPPPPPSPQLVVGYVSSDFNNHPLAHLMQSVFGMHDRQKFKSICYATTPSDKSVHRQQIEREAPKFRDASSWSVETLVQQIIRDGVHILINLNGYTRGARNEIFAARPAPVQMSFMGFAGTLGAEWCDYLLADEVSVPPKTLRPHRSNHDLEDLIKDTNHRDNTDDWVYTENVIFARDASFCCDHRQSASGAKEREVTWNEEQRRRWKMRKELFPDLPSNAVIFGNFNQLYKIDPTTFRTWLRILDQVPNSYLWLLKFPADGAAHLLQTATAWASASIAARIIFTDVAPKPLHIARGCIIDLFLDTPECNAHTTAADCLWSGTPLLTCTRYEWKMCSRIAAGILAGAVDRKTAEGSEAWEELVVENMDEYERRAVRLGKGLNYERHKDGARGRGRLMELREMLWKRRWTSPLFDTHRWVKDLELAYEEAWRRWVVGIGGDIYVKDLIGHR